MIMINKIPMFIANTSLFYVLDLWITLLHIAILAGRKAVIKEEQAILNDSLTGY